MQNMVGVIPNAVKSFDSILSTRECAVSKSLGR